MDRKTMGLAIALAYPSYAFFGEPPFLIEEARELVTGAQLDKPANLEVRAFLRQHPGLNEWVEQLLEDPDLVPPEWREDGVRSFKPLTGNGKPITAPRYVCPIGEAYVWYQASVGEPVPSCPWCKNQLRLA